jgi:BlaI family transcriptional regulator, penicillinase repressor
VTQRSIHSRPLTKLQQAILNYIWANTTSTAEQVREAIAAEHPLRESSIRTLLRRLEAQGYLAHTVEGQTFVYRATAGRESVAAGAVRSVIERFWAGSVEQFVLGMVDEKVLTPGQLENLARKVRDAR